MSSKAVTFNISYCIEKNTVREISIEVFSRTIHDQIWDVFSALTNELKKDGMDFRDIILTNLDKEILRIRAESKLTKS